MRLLTRILASISVATFVYGQNGAGGGLAPGQQIVDEGNGQKSVPLRTHSLYPPYLDSDLQSRWFVHS
jgi:mannose-binding lectin 2